MTDELSLVPPDRLGALLTEHRTRRGLSIEELHLGAAVDFSADELRRIEQGQLTLTDSQINRLLRAYDAGAGPIVPERTDLVVDVGAGAMFVGRRTKVFPVNPDLDDVLGRYLSLLYLMRGLEPGDRLPLRVDDLEVLAAALERSVTDVERRLFGLMLPDEVSPWYRRIRHRLAVPAAGIVVGLTTVGTLVLVQFPEGSRPSTDPSTLAVTAAPALATELAPAVVVTRDIQPNAPEAELIPPTVVDRDGDAAVADQPAVLGEAAEALIDYPFRSQLPDWTVVYVGPREGYRGNTNTVTRTITLYIAPDDTPEDLAGVLGHEIGHALDVMYLDDDMRDEWLAMRGIDGDWWPDSGANDFDLGAGDFAEAVALLIADSPSNAERGDFTAAQLAHVRSLLP